MHVCNSAPLCWFLLLSQAPLTVHKHSHPGFSSLNSLWPRNGFSYSITLHSVQWLLVCSPRQGLPALKLSPLFQWEVQNQRPGWHLISVLVLLVPSQWPRMRMSKLHHSDINPSLGSLPLQLLRSGKWQQSVKQNVSAPTRRFLNWIIQHGLDSQLQCPCCEAFFSAWPLISPTFELLQLFGPESFHLSCCCCGLCLLCSWFP